MSVARALFRGRRLSAWTALVPVVAMAAGLLFATSGRTALGTDLRAGEVADLSQLIDQRERALSLQLDELADLEAQVQRLTDQAGQPEQRRRGGPGRGAGGRAVGGPRRPARPRPGHHPRRRPLAARREPADRRPTRRPGHPPVRRPGGRERPVGGRRRRRRGHGPAADRHQRRPLRRQHPAAAGPHLLPAVRHHRDRRRRRRPRAAGRLARRSPSSSRPCRPSG